MWTFTAPDGSTLGNSDEVPETVEAKLELLRAWYEVKIAPWKKMRAIAEYEISTGHKFEEPYK